METEGDTGEGDSDRKIRATGGDSNKRKYSYAGRQVILNLLLKVDGAGDGYGIAVLCQYRDMSRPVVLRRVEVDAVVARVVLRPAVVYPPVPVRRPRLARDVSHNLNF